MKAKSEKPKATIFTERGTTRDFLFTPPAASLEDLTSASAGAGKSETVWQAFPDVLRGDEFIRHAMEQVGHMTCFSAMLIRLDGDQRALNSDGNGNNQLKLADVGRVVNGLCKRENGTWGAMDGDSLGCFFPGKNDADALHLAQDIQRQVRERSNGSVSIGVAAYPTGEYKKAQIIENARKALTHASFFGADSRVLFDAVSLNISGDERYQKGDVSGAIDELKNALKLDPENTNVLNSLGVCYGVSGDLDRALVAFRKAIQKDPNEVMALYNAGYVKAMLKETEDALTYYQKAEAVDEDVFEVIFQLGKLYLEQKNLAAAKTYLEKAVRLQPESWIAYFHLAECCEALGVIDEAVAHYETAVKKNPADACALSALGSLYDEKAENPEISTLFCEKACEISPDNGLFQFRLGRVYARQGQPEKALSAFRRAESLGYQAEADVAVAQSEIREEVGDR